MPESAWDRLADLYMQIDPATFQHPFSQARDLNGILDNMLPGAQAGDWMTAPRKLREEGIQAVLHIKMKDGRRARLDLYPGDRISLDSSALKSGESTGSALYQATADYALKNGLVFMGDPQGLSEIAVFRRTEQMLSAALRAGTTRHLAPHPRQMNPGNPDHGEAVKDAHPLRWETGNDRANIASMLETAYRNVAEIVPEISNFRYNFEHGRFEPVAEKSDLDPRCEYLRLARQGRAKAAGIGRNTIARAVLARTLLQGEGRAVGAGVVPEHAGAAAGQGINPLESLLETQAEALFYQTQDPAAGGVSVSGDGLENQGHPLSPLGWNGMPDISLLRL